MFPRSVHEYFVARVRDIASRRDATLAGLRSREDAQAYCKKVKSAVRNCFGPWPERTPLNARVVRTLRRDRYVIEHLLYESRPGYCVTANVYRPPGEGRFPAVLGLCGHSTNGKAAPPYAQFCRILAMSGYVVLILDPVGQGERYQYPDQSPPWGTSLSPCGEHNLAGNQMSLVGDSFSTWRAWDAIRGLDYLLARPDVDTTRVGVTGNSGGGTLSTYLNALDDRITMAAPSCFVTTYLANLENELPADSEQYPPGILAAELDMSDFFLAQAPRPTLLMGQTFDFFDVRGLKKAYEQIRHVYGLLGAADNVQLHIGPGAHGYGVENRQAMYRLFHARANVDGIVDEPELPAETEQGLQVTETGRVIDLSGNRRIFEFTADAARALSRSRETEHVGRCATGVDLVERITAALNLPQRNGAPHYRILRDRYDAYSGAFQNVQLYAVETEPRYPSLHAILHAWNKINPLKGKSSGGEIPAVTDAIVYLPHTSAREDLLGGQLPVTVETSLFAIEARGIGMGRQLTCNDEEFFDVYGADYMYAGYGRMLGESYCGRRVHDVLATLDLLASRGTQRVHLIGRGLGSVLAAFAGLLHPLVGQVTLKNAPASFETLATAPVNLWPLSSLVSGVLNSFDLPDVYRELSSKQLRRIDPWDARMQPA